MEHIRQDGYQGEVDVYQESMQHIRGKKRARRAKGKKKKQKTSLMITNDDGTDSTTQVPCRCNHYPFSTLRLSILSMWRGLREIYHGRRFT